MVEAEFHVIFRFPREGVPKSPSSDIWTSLLSLWLSCCFRHPKKRWPRPCWQNSHSKWFNTSSTRIWHPSTQNLLRSQPFAPGLHVSHIRWWQKIACLPWFPITFCLTDSFNQKEQSITRFLPKATCSVRSLGICIQGSWKETTHRGRYWTCLDSTSQLLSI